jgi:cell division protein YceG involved in septum cleavage
LLNNIHKNSLIKGAICTVGLFGGGSKIIPLSLKKWSEGVLAPHTYATDVNYTKISIIAKNCIIKLNRIL